MRSRGGGGAFGNRPVQVWRMRMPAAVLALVIATAVLSIVGTVLQRNGVFPVVSLGALIPAEVWAGQVWRLVTWPFFQIDPIGLVFACLMFYWFGGELCRTWGWKRFLGVFFGFAVGVGVVTTLIGRFLWSDVFQGGYIGLWPISEAMVIAWAILFPTREIAIYFVLPVGGRALIALTIVGTTLFALYYGFAGFVPHYLAEFAMLIYMGSLRRAVLRWKRSRLQQKQKRDYVATVLRFDRKEDREGPPSDKPPKWLN